MKKKSLRTLTNKLDGIFSKYIRLRDADGRGNCRCITCERVFHWTEMDAGHFVGRQHRSTRWLEINVHAQCRYDNRYCEGKKDVYAVRLVEKYGPHILFDLQQQKNSIAKWTTAELEEMVNHYKARLKELECSVRAIDSVASTS